MTGRAVEEELLRRLPSQEDDIDIETEAQLRIYGAESIQRAGVLLRVPQITMISACAILQHFYCRRSFAEFDVQSCACACLLLACKLEETHRKLRDVVQVFHRVQMRAHEEKGELAYTGKPTPFLDLTSREYVDMKQEVIRAERHVLLDLGFEVEKLQEPPHRHLLELAELLGQKPGAFLQKAWNYLNDSLRSLLICAHEPRVIAAASIFLAARDTGLKLPSEPPWWHAIGIELEDMRHIAKSILALYRRAPAQYVFVERRKKQRVVEPLVALGPATPFPETPGPVKSPSDDGDGDDNGPDPASQPQPPQVQDTVVGSDGDRLAEMLDEQRGDAVAAAGLPAARAAPGKVVSGVGERTTSTENEGFSTKGKKDVDRKSTVPRDEKDRRGREKEKEKERERERAKERDKKRAREKRTARSDSSSGGAGSSGKSRSRSADRKAKIATKARGRESAARKGALRRSASSSSNASSSSRRQKRRGKRSVDSREL